MPASSSNYGRLDLSTSSINITTSTTPQTRSRIIRYILFATVVLLLISGVTTALTVLLITHANHHHHHHTSTYSNSQHAISRTCSTARYRSLCVSTLTELSSGSAASRSRVELVHMSVNVTLQRFGSALLRSVEIGNWKMDSFQLSAYEDCVELLEDSVDLLIKALRSVRHYYYHQSGVRRHGSNEDVTTWLSAALTNQDTCTEGLSLSSTSSVKQEMTHRMKDLSKLVSNCLAIYTAASSSTINHNKNNDFTAGVTTINHHRRRLLAHGAGERNWPKQQQKKWKYSHYNDKTGIDEDDEGIPRWVWKRDSDMLSMMKLTVMGGAPTPSPSPTPTPMPQPDVVVALDGSGTVKTITEAIKLAPNYSQTRFIIHLKSGTYEEPNLKISRKKTNIWLIGSGQTTTIITGSRNVAHDKITTFHTATFAATGSNFFAQDLTFTNYAGPTSHQAVALRVSSDHAVIHRCTITGYQDTLYVHSNRQFYRDCSVHGTVDFIFGNAAVVFQHSNLISLTPLPQQKNTVTAQNRRDPNQNTGMSMHECRVYGDGVTYLGRPWKMYARVVYMMTYMGENVAKEGWLEWNETVGTTNLYYGEYMNGGPGSSVDGRVKWKGVHSVMTVEEAGMFTVNRFIGGGDGWLAKTGVDFKAGLS